jgi:phosphate transport system ATP-binding protein
MNRQFDTIMPPAGMTDTSTTARRSDAPIQVDMHVNSLCTDHLSLQLDGREILSDISADLPAAGITCLIGPSGAGKSSLLRCINRLHEQWQGDITLAGQSVRSTNADALRRQIGLIGQKPAVFPCSIRDNVIFGLTRQQRKSISEEGVRTALIQAALWQEVEERLDEPADHLSIGQQQRLCLARALILAPAMLLLDEPTSALDPRSRDIIERTMSELAYAMPLLWVTHDLEQARRISRHIIFICDGRLIEQGDANSFFTRPNCVESREFLRWSVCDC